MHDDRVDQAIVDAANAIGADVSYLSPAQARHFDSATLLYAFAGSVLGAFMTGLASQLGKITAQSMADACKRLFAAGEDDQRAELKRLAETFEQSQRNLAKEEIEIRMESCEQTLTATLGTYGFPDSIAAAKARAVRQVVSVRFIK